MYPDEFLQYPANGDDDAVHIHPDISRRNKETCMVGIGNSLKTFPITDFHRLMRKRPSMI